MNTSTNDTAAQPRESFALWFGMLGPPAVWLTQFEIKYALAGSVGETWRPVILIVTGLVSLLVVAGTAAMSWRQHRLAGASPLDHTAGIVARIRFMAAIGLMSSGLFFLVIAAQNVADLFFKPGIE